MLARTVRFFFFFFLSRRELDKDYTIRLYGGGVGAREGTHVRVRPQIAHLHRSGGREAEITPRRVRETKHQVERFALAPVGSDVGGNGVAVEENDGSSASGERTCANNEKLHVKCYA